MTNWPKHPDGRGKKIGEMTREERNAVCDDAARKLQAEAVNPNSVFYRACLAILNGPVDNKTRH